MYDSEILFAKFTGLTTDSVLVAAPGANKRIVVLAYLVSEDADGTFIFHSKVGADASVAITGTVDVTGKVPSGMSSAAGCFACAANAALRGTFSSSADGHITYTIQNVP